MAALKGTAERKMYSLQPTAASVFFSKESKRLNNQLQMTSGSQEEAERLKP